MARRQPDSTDPLDSTTTPLPAGGQVWLTTEQIRAYLRVSRTKLWHLVNNEGLPAFKVGGDYRYNRAEVDAWMERFRVRPGGEEELATK